MATLLGWAKQAEQRARDRADTLAGDADEGVAALAAREHEITSAPAPLLAAYAACLVDGKPQLR